MWQQVFEEHILRCGSIYFGEFISDTHNTYQKRGENKTTLIEFDAYFCVCVSNALEPLLSVELV